MKVCAITPTGNRPEAFALCQRWMERQTLKPAEWIIVDDGEPETPIPFRPYSVIVRPTEKWIPGTNTLQRNLLEALPYIGTDIEAIAIIEDDDWYHPRYLEMMCARLEAAHVLVTGEANPFYYHLPTRRYTTLDRPRVAGFSQSVFRPELIPILYKVLRDPKTKDRPDVFFWEKIRQKFPRQEVFRNKAYLCPISAFVLGMKGMPGREGIGIGHNYEYYRHWKVDKEPSILHNMLIEGDFELYEPYLGKPELCS